MLSTKSFGSPPNKSISENPAIDIDSSVFIASLRNESLRSSGALLIWFSIDSILSFINCSTSKSVNVGSEGKDNASQIVSNLSIKPPNVSCNIPNPPFCN